MWGHEKSLFEFLEKLRIHVFCLCFQGYVISVKYFIQHHSSLGLRAVVFGCVFDFFNFC